jgi:DNA recombination protein RmuC
METTLLVVIAAAIFGLLGWVFAGRRADASLKAAKAAAEQSEAQIRQVLIDKATAETRLVESEKTLQTVVRERDAAFSDRNQARLDLQESEKQIALARQEVAAAEKRMADWEKTREESLLHAKAAVLEAANTVSTKLLADHKLETEAAKKEAAERLEKTTKAIGEQFETVVKTVASLNDQVVRNRDMTDTVWRALSSPGGAGHFAEIGLENCLKSFGLERGRDFAIQQEVSGDSEGGRLRPDAIVFLPFDSVLVIDSKASKFLLELASAEDEEDEEQGYINLARTMNGHLRALSNKDYRAAIVANFRAAGRTGELRRVLNVMYLPNESALEKLCRADPDFPKKAAAAEIIVAGPTGLAGIIGFARVDIDLGRQAENQEKIVEAAQALLEGVGYVLANTEQVGKGIKSAAEGFMKLTGSINSRLLPRTRRLAQLGVRPVKSKGLPTAIRSYQVIEIDGHTTIDGEAEEVVAPALTDQSEPVR